MAQSQPIQSSALPSFDSLVASLGIPHHPPQDVRIHRRTHSRNSSGSFVPPSNRQSSSRIHSRRASCSSTVPDLDRRDLQTEDPPSVSHRLERARSFTRLRGARYTPYFAENFSPSHGRRPSLPTLLNELSLSASKPALSDASSPSLSPIDSPVSPSSSESWHRPVPLASKKPKELHLSSMPISSFVRRRTPQASPTTMSYSIIKERQSSPLTALLPVALPTVPFVSAIPSPRYDAVQTVPETLSPDFVFPQTRRVRQVGIRISSCLDRSGVTGRHSPSLPAITT